MPARAAVNEPQLIILRPGGNLFTNGILMVLPPIVLTNGASIDFGNGVIDGTIRTFSITNAGGTNLSVQKAFIIGTNASDFIFSITPAPNIASGEEIPFAVRFSPNGLGLRTAILRIISTDLDDSPFDIHITGTGVSPFRMLRQANLKASDTETNDQFGTSVAIWGDTMVIGAPNECSSSTGVNGNQTNINAFQSGSAYVFVRSGTNWTQQAYLKASNTGAGDHFGDSVAIFGDTIVIGAPSESSSATGINGNQSNDNATNSGAAYVFVRSGNSWSQMAYLKASNTGAGDRFGDAVALSSDLIVVGAPVEASDSREVNGNQNDDSAPFAGAAYVFARSDSNWTQQAYLKGPLNDGLGVSVAIAGDTAVVGSIDSPMAPVFVRHGTNWIREAVLTNDDICLSVAIAEDTIIVGTPEESSVAEESGAANIYIRNGTNWIRQAILKASNARDGDSFGKSVSIYGDTVVVGATGQGNNGGEYPPTGAAYVFIRRGINWVQQAFLKFSYAEANADDNFGSSVAAFGNTAVVGIPREDSGTTGVNSGFNYGKPGSGTVFVYSGIGLGPKLTVRTDGIGNHLIRVNGTHGSTNRLQRTSDLSGVWSTVATSNAPSSGLIEFRVTPMPGSGFYRSISP